MDQGQQGGAPEFVEVTQQVVALPLWLAWRAARRILLVARVEQMIPLVPRVEPVIPLVTRSPQTHPASG